MMALCTKFRQYEFTTMPFGLNGSAATFQTTMELISKGLQWTMSIIYIDDIVTFSSTFQFYVTRVEEVLERIKSSGLKLQAEKCELFQTCVNFLGHTVSNEGMKPCPENIVKIVQWRVPGLVKQVKSILGMGSFYRRFIKEYAEMVKPLTELAKGKTFLWSPKCEDAFNRLKKALVSTDIIGHPTNEDLFVLDVDA